MKKMNRILMIFVLMLWAFVARAEADFETWKQNFYKQAQGKKVSTAILDKYLVGAVYLPRVVELDRAQPEFRMSFGSYMQKLVSPERIRGARMKFDNHSRPLGRVENLYGVPAHYLVAFWGIETNFGATKGGINTVDALATLAYDDRRSEFFTEQLITLLKVLDKEGIEAPVGSWAGAFGHFQFMPTTFYQYAVDGDDDGRRDVYHSFEDALASAAHYLQRMGWKKGESWGRPVLINNPKLVEKLGEKHPISEWVKWGVSRADGKVFKPEDGMIMAELLLPEGVNGPAFLTYQNFDVIKRWNRSDSYALAVGVLADNIINRPTLDVQNLIVLPPLSIEEVKSMQRGLATKGFYEGDIDGRMGKNTRKALKEYQKSQSLAPDEFLSKELLEKIVK